MTECNTFKQVIGFIIGIGIFMLLIPFFIWFISTLDNPVCRLSIIPGHYMRLIISLPLFVVGMIFAIWSNILLVIEGKGGPTNVGEVTISPKTKKLVTNGPYKYTRNPMAFGVNALYLSLAIYFNSLGSLLAVAVFFILLVRAVIASEEKRLLDDFGGKYVDYAKRTSKLIPLPQKELQVSVDRLFCYYHKIELFKSKETICLKEFITSAPDLPPCPSPFSKKPLRT